MKPCQTSTISIYLHPSLSTSNMYTDVTTAISTQEVIKVMYSGPSLKGHSLERTPLYKGQKCLAASTANTCNAPSHLGTPL